MSKEEYWDIVDESGNSTGEKLLKSEVIKRNLYHTGVDIWIVNKNKELLIQKRAASKRIAPNVWAMTGGACISGETSKECLKRECLEELNIEIDIEKLVFIEKHNSGNIWLESYLLEQEVDIDAIILQEEEVSEVKFATFNEIEELFKNGEFMPQRWEFVREHIIKKYKSSKLLSYANIKVIGYITTILSIVFSIFSILIYKLWFMGIFGLISFAILCYLEKSKKTINDNWIWMNAIGIVSCIITTISLFFMLGRTFINIVL